MENSLFVLLGFAEAAEKYMAENSGKTLEGLSNIDLPNLKKSIADSIGSFDVSKDSNSEKIGELVFKQFLKEKENPSKKNVVEELGQIFDVDFEAEISEEKEAKLKIDDLLANYETEFVEEEKPQEETKVETKQNDKVEVAKETAEDFEMIINEIIGIKGNEEIEEYTGEVFHTVKKPEPNPVVAEIIKDNDEFVGTLTDEISEIVHENVGSFVVEEEKKEEEIKADPLTNEELTSIVSEVMIDIANDAVGEFEVVEEDFEENKKLVDEIKDVFENLEENKLEENENRIVFEEENDFGLDENDEILKAIRKAAGFDEVEDETKLESPVFQPAPDELDSLFEEVEANEKDTSEVNEEEVEPMSQEDYLKSLSGLINYGQFDELLNEESKEVEEEREVHYILNPLIDEQDKQDEHYVVSDEQEEIEEENSEEEVEEVLEEAQEKEGEVENYYVSPQELALHFIENPGLDVVFDGDDVIYSSYEEETETEEEVLEETSKDLEEVIDELLNDTLENEVEEETEVLDENEKYVDDLLNDYEFSNNKVDELLSAREETYNIISKMYPYLNYAFIKSAYDLKDSIADEYKEGEDLIILHRASFRDVEDLRKYAELMMNHSYQVNVDEKQMIVDTLKSYNNVDGLILNSIFEVANQINLLNGEYEGYCVLTEDSLSV